MIVQGRRERERLTEEAKSVIYKGSTIHVTSRGMFTSAK